MPELYNTNWRKLVTRLPSSNIVYSTPTRTPYRSSNYIKKNKSPYKGNREFHKSKYTNSKEGFVFMKEGPQGEGYYRATNYIPQYKRFIGKINGFQYMDNGPKGTGYYPTINHKKGDLEKLEIMFNNKKSIAFEPTHLSKRTKKNNTSNNRNNTRKTNNIQTQQDYMRDCPKKILKDKSLSEQKRNKLCLISKERKKQEKVLQSNRTNNLTKERKKQLLKKAKTLSKKIRGKKELTKELTKERKKELTKERKKQLLKKAKTLSKKIRGKKQLIKKAKALSKKIRGKKQLEQNPVIDDDGEEYGFTAKDSKVVKEPKEDKSIKAVEAVKN